MRIYCASRVRHAAIWQKIRSEGVNIISTWIDEAGEGESASIIGLWGRIEEEVKSADRLVLYVQADDFPLKGALVEAGMALACKIPVFVVLGPGVKLEEHSLRPLGSWACHPLVKFVPFINSAVRETHP